jgi:hypothetical protein
MDSALTGIYFFCVALNPALEPLPPRPSVASRIRVNVLRLLLCWKNSRMMLAKVSGSFSYPF